jgi:hypothetical protein
VFQRFREALLSSIRRSANTFRRKYFGHLVSPEEVTTEPKKLKVVWDTSTLKNIEETRSFLGQYIYYRRFISGFSNIVKPLTKLTEEKQAFR